MSLIEQYFSTETQFKQAFADGLNHILDYKSAGTFILACANAYQNKELRDRYQQKLAEIFALIKHQYLLAESSQTELTDAEDDISVMKQLIRLDLSKLSLTETRLVGADATAWQVSYNQLRSFRPGRMSAGQSFVLETAFNDNGFHFDKAFLKKEVFLEGEWNHKSVSLLYNKFPFIDYHGLLVIDKHKHLNQYLTQEMLSYIFALQNQVQNSVKKIGIAYNSIGAGASVNHLHFQIFIPSQMLSLFSPEWQHNGGIRQYPAYCLLFNNADDCWLYVSQLHERNIAYNLVFQQNKIYCLPRKRPAISSEFNCSGFGWFEMAGGFTCFDKSGYDNLLYPEIEQAIQSISASPDI